MTVKELSQLYFLQWEIAWDAKRLKKLEEQASTPAAARLTGMPKTPAARSAVERYAAEIVDLQAIIAAKQIQCIHGRTRIERYIANIGDSETRLIFKRRFVDGASWAEVAETLGPGHTADQVKKVCYRYLIREGEQGEDLLARVEREGAL